MMMQLLMAVFASAKAHGGGRKTPDGRKLFQWPDYRAHNTEALTTPRSHQQQRGSR
jgi:hypothetical protein